MEKTFGNKNEYSVCSVDSQEKLPEGLNRETYFVVKLSQRDRFFRIGN